MEHLKAQLEMKKAKTGKTGALFWSKMVAAFGDPDPDSEALDLSAIDDEDVEALPIFECFTQLFSPHWNREATFSMVQDCDDHL